MLHILFGIPLACESFDAFESIIFIKMDPMPCQYYAYISVPTQCQVQVFYFP